MSASEQQSEDYHSKGACALIRFSKLPATSQWFCEENGTDKLAQDNNETIQQTDTTQKPPKTYFFKGKF